MENFGKVIWHVLILKMMIGVWGGGLYDVYACFLKDDWFWGCIIG